MGIVNYIKLIKIQSVLLEIIESTIIPYIYEDARRYYTLLLETQTQNTEKVQQTPEVNNVVIYIKSPQRKKNKKRKLFTFLDEEALNEQ